MQLSCAIDQVAVQRKYPIFKRQVDGISHSTIQGIFWTPQKRGMGTEVPSGVFKYQCVY